MTISEFGRSYLLLGLRLGKLIDGYVDSYFGPQELSQVVLEEGKQPPSELLEEARRLYTVLPDRGFAEEREHFIRKMLEAMTTSLELLSGIHYPYVEKVRRLFDVEPQLTSDDVFHDASRVLDELYDGGGTLPERMENYRKQNALPQEQVGPTMSKAFDMVRRQTDAVFGAILPDDESIDVQVVKNAPWSAYNWYLGKAKSRIDINTDLPVQWNNVLHLATHEGYPGHHTEHAVKESILYQEQGRFENAILLVHTPEATVSEGIGNMGEHVFYSPEELVKIGLEQFCPNPSDEPAVEVLVARDEAMSKLSAFSGNLAIHAHVDGWTDDEIVKYATQFGFTSEQRVRQQLKFIRDPLWSPYVFNYFYGEKLIRDKFGPRPSPANFVQLLTKPVLPSDLR